jgi:hypothetical protein
MESKKMTLADRMTKPDEMGASRIEPVLCGFLMRYRILCNVALAPNWVLLSEISALLLSIKLYPKLMLSLLPIAGGKIT